MNEPTHQQIIDFIQLGLAEDVGEGDHTSEACIPPGQSSRAHLLVKDRGILAGVAVAEKIFCHLDPEARMEVLIGDGQQAGYGEVSFYLTCNTIALLKGERLALNLMQRLSGIATLSRQFVEAVQGYEVTILDTRKTTPLLRFLEKWAVSLGGCSNYRDGLYDRIMIKDNHIQAAGSISKAVKKVEEYLKSKELELAMTIEVRTRKELKEVLKLKSQPRIMLDNFDLPDLDQAVNLIGGKLECEASGGIKLSNVRQYAATGVDFISVGALTHSAQSLDLSLKIIE